MRSHRRCHSPFYSGGTVTASPAHSTHAGSRVRRGSYCRYSVRAERVANPIMIMGCSSDAGKSFLVTALCRHFANRSVRVAPFKAQNMSNNAAVTPDGLEIGRAQYLQALAARTSPQARLNPVLLNPSADTYSQVIVMGKYDSEVS